MNVKLLVAVVVVVGVASAVALQTTADDPLEIVVLSNRSDLISGGTALVEVRLPDDVDPSNLRVEITTGDAGRDISAAFARRPNGTVQGLVEGLPLGSSSLVASIDGRGSPAGRIAVTNYPFGGPIFAGPQVQPWFCQTVENGLGPAQDDQCTTASKVEFFYRSPTSEEFLTYDPANPPVDVAETTTDQGLTVPYVVRREQGTLDRGIYSFAVLIDPEAPLAPWEPPAAWNRKLYYPFGGGASPSHRQAAPRVDVLMDLPLGRGFVVATTSLNTFGNNFNSVVSAEAVMMLKEHVVETLGPIAYTFSTGGSGGAMQQQLIANAYPGLLDGIQPSASFPDIWKNFREVQDCALLLRYFKSTSPAMWSDVAERNLVMDNANEMPGTCESWRGQPDTWGSPTIGCWPQRRGEATTPQTWIYDPDTNPGGTRCTLQDYQVAMFGTRPDGFANSPFDNVGVQYGLRALDAGFISPEQFVDMNEQVGGLDIDLNWMPERSVADPVALDVVYRTGQLNLGNGMNRVPIIDNRACRNFEVHSCYHTWVTRARLDETHGDSANQVVFLNPPDDASFRRDGSLGRCHHG